MNEGFWAELSGNMKYAMLMTMTVMIMMINMMMMTITMTMTKSRGPIKPMVDGLVTNMDDGAG